MNTDIPTSEPGGTPSLEPEAAAAEEDASDQEEEEALGPAERLARTFGGPKQKAAGKAKAKATAPKPSAKAKSSFPVSATAKPLASAPARPAALQPKPAVANTAQAAIAGAGETLQLDGRGKRLKENLREILEKVETQLEEHLSVTFSLAQADAKQVYPKKTKAMNALLNSVSKQRKKIEDSVNKAGLLEELERYLPSGTRHPSFSFRAVCQAEHRESCVSRTFRCCCSLWFRPSDHPPWSRSVAEIVGDKMRALLLVPGLCGLLPAVSFQPRGGMGGAHYLYLLPACLEKVPLHRLIF